MMTVVTLGKTKNASVFTEAFFCIFLLFYNLVMLLIRGGKTEEGYVVSVKGIVIVTIPCCKGNDNICIITCFSFHF